MSPDPERHLFDIDLADGLLACLAVPRWVDEVAAQAPFATVEELVAAGRRAATPLSPAEVDQALQHHPRIGERAVGEGPGETFSRAEQAAADSGDEELAAALKAGNAAYERRFGRVFLIRAAGRSRAEILAELTRRLKLDEQTEVGIVADELRDIASLRMAQLFAHLDRHSGYDDSEAAR
jgi:2-oxo-4-hydroxy-4-carboxy-5-ureidoimidazoline decarboxylase